MVKGEWKNELLEVPKKRRTALVDKFAEEIQNGYRKDGRNTKWLKGRWKRTG